MDYKIEKTESGYKVSRRVLKHLPFAELTDNLQEFLANVGDIKSSKQEPYSAKVRSKSDFNTDDNSSYLNGWISGISYEELAQQASSFKEIDQIYTSYPMYVLAPIGQVYESSFKGWLKWTFSSSATKDAKIEAANKEIKQRTHDFVSHYVSTSDKYDEKTLVNEDHLEEITDMGNYRILKLNDDFAPYNKIKTRLHVNDLLAIFSNQNYTVTKSELKARAIPKAELTL